MEDLDFSYEISGNLYAEYQFVKKLLAMAVCKNTAQNLRDAQQVLKNLYDAFQEAAQQDTSEPLMQHAQQVVAGMTYQKGSLRKGKGCICFRLQEKKNLRQLLTLYF